MPRVHISPSTTLLRTTTAQRLRGINSLRFVYFHRLGFTRRSFSPSKLLDSGAGSDCSLIRRLESWVGSPKQLRIPLQSACIPIAATDPVLLSPEVTILNRRTVFSLFA